MLIWYTKVVNWYANNLIQIITAGSRFLKLLILIKFKIVYSVLYFAAMRHPHDTRAASKADGVSNRVWLNIYGRCRPVWVARLVAN